MLSSLCAAPASCQNGRHCCSWSFAFAGLSVCRLFLLTAPSSLPPSRQRSFFGKQFEHQRGGAPHSRHTAGTERYWRVPSAYLHPDIPGSCSDHYHFCSDHYHSLTHTHTQKNPAALGRERLCFKATKAPTAEASQPPLHLPGSPAGLICAVMLCGVTGSGVFKWHWPQIHVNGWKQGADQEVPFTVCVNSTYRNVFTSGILRPFKSAANTVCLQVQEQFSVHMHSNSGT